MRNLIRTLQGLLVANFVFAIGFAVYGALSLLANSEPASGSFKIPFRADELPLLFASHVPKAFYYLALAANLEFLRRTLDTTEPSTLSQGTGAALRSPLRTLARWSQVALIAACLIQPVNSSIRLASRFTMATQRDYPFDYVFQSLALASDLLSIAGTLSIVVILELLLRLDASRQSNATLATSSAPSAV